MTIALTLLFFPFVPSSLEKEMVTQSSIIPGESHGQRSLSSYSPWGHKSWTPVSDQTKKTPPLFILLSFAWFYGFFSTGQVPLYTLSWCSACTCVSEGVFLVCPWREMHSTSTHTSAILFLCVVYI